MIFKLFLWKNIQQIKYSWISILFLYFSCLLLIGIYFHSTYIVVHNPTTIHESKNIDILKLDFTGGDNDLIYYYPSGNDFLDELMNNVRKDLSLTSEKFLSYSTIEELNLNFEVNKNSRSFSIIFHEFPNSLNEAIQSKKFNYSLSSTTCRVSTNKRFYNDEEVIGIKEHDEYIATGFLTLQHLIDYNYYLITTEKHPDLEVEISPMPHIKSESVDSYRALSFGILFAVLFYVILLNTFLLPIVEEKQDGIKKIITLCTPYHYYDDFCFYSIRFISYLVYAGIALLIGYIYVALGTVYKIYVIGLILLFINASICYTTLIATVFTKVFTAKIGGFILLFSPCFAYFVEDGNIAIFKYIFHSSSFYEGFQILQIYTNKNKKMNMFENVTEKSFTLIHVYLILFIQSFGYIVLHIILNTYLNGDLNTYSFINIFKICETNDINDMDTINKNKEYAIKLNNVTKQYKKVCNNYDLTAVKNLNLNVKNNGITVLLGHNGAGKSTLMNMIVGALKPTSGTISIFDQSNYKSSKYLIGYCPQQNIFMKYMTCKDHILFFAELRKMSVEESENNAVELLQTLYLDDKSNDYPVSLSGGMKRRLCLGIAIAGNSKIIILDEPSSGLDPESRRKLWDILLDLRKNKCVLVTTHHMEEAEVLGDYVSIVAHGELIRSGKALELKKAHGSGYVLKLLITSECNQTNLINDIQKIIPTAKRKTFLYPTLYISLPYAEKSKYKKLFKRLEDYSTILGIENISIADTTLEEIFLNCSETYDEVDSNKFDSCSPYNEFQNEIDLNSNFIGQQIRAIFYKKIIFIKKEYIYTLIMCLIPIIMTIIAFILLGNVNKTTSLPPLDLDLKLYPNSTIYVKIDKELNELKNCIEEKVIFNHINVKFINEALNLTNVLLGKQYQDISKFNGKYLGAIEITKEFNKIDFKMLYSKNFIHSSVILLNFIDNLILNLNNCNTGEIETLFKPYTRINEMSEITPLRLETYSHILPIGFFLYIMFYLCLPYKEEKIGFKNLQQINGKIYWLTFNCFDLIQHLIVCFVILCLHLCFLPSSTYLSTDLVWIISAYAFYGFAYLPTIYNLSRMFDSMSTLSSVMFLMFIVSSIAPLITSANIQSMENYENYIAILSFLPDFLLKHQLILINENFFINRQNQITKYTSSNIVLKHNKQLNLTKFYIYAILIYFIGQIYLIFIWENINRRQFLKDIYKGLLDFFTLQWFKHKRITGETSEAKCNEGVQSESEKVEQIYRDHFIADYPLIVRKIKKRYNTGKIAVNDVSFSVEKGACFGLLGLNGAGKTSMFQMLTLNEKITDGSIKISGIDIIKQKEQYKIMYGYCPQGDALNTFMTSYEILKYMAMLRGVPHGEVDKMVLSILNDCNLMKYKNIPVKCYSGGTKRKLNTALSMIGRPRLVLLDEPTTGVDPLSRRFIWNSIQKFQSNDRTIILTSHSMDECENLCNRLAIMARGQFKCIGNIQSLKKEFGNGWTLTINLNDNITIRSENDLKTDIKKILPSSELREQHAGILTYFVKQFIVNWSEIFSKVEYLAETHKTTINDYSVNEVSLEDVFLTFDKDVSKLETI